ncbi:hypothetical protein ACHAW5_010952 [Stephanodiscus triporus]|uniref:Peptidase C1A papain C-terminal domain-containing protein n=1 Tax=Stephanodiscus triporus TaxID=2934178 RepID=A0ABD3QRE1_9STRA
MDQGSGVTVHSRRSSSSARTSSSRGGVGGRRRRDDEPRTKERRRRNADVLYSDDDASSRSSSSESEIDDSAAAGDEAGRFSREGRESSGRMPGDDGDLDDLLIGVVGGGGDRGLEDGDGDGDDDDDDEGVMNPYVVMNPPFVRTMEYSSSPPAVVETTPISMELSSSSIHHRHQRPRQIQEERGKMNDDAVRHHPLSVFDPYSPNPPIRDESSRHHRARQRQRPSSSSGNGMEMEEEDEEIVDFVRDDGGFIVGSSCHRRLEEEQFETIPPPQHMPRRRVVEDGWRDLEESTSFSPYFPKNDDRGGYYNTRPHPSPSPYNGPGGAIPGMLSAMSDASRPVIDLVTSVLTAALSTVVHAGTVAVHAATSNSYVYGRDEDDDRNVADRRRNPFRPAAGAGSSGGGARRGGGWRRISSANMRLLVVATIALLCLRNLTSTVYRDPTRVGGESTGGGGSSSPASNSGVATRIKKAREHWWSKKRRGGGGDQAVATEVYLDGKKAEDVVVGGVGHNDSSASSGVVVQTREDGTILIKLPKPRMHLEEPSSSILAAADNAASLHALREPEIDPARSRASDVDDGETMYIKLPYPPRGQQVIPKDQKRRLVNVEEVEGIAKREIEPPLRGAAPQESVQLRKFSPLTPLVDESERIVSALGAKKGKHDDGGGLLHELRSEFESWASKHGKRYASHHEKEHRFNVWRKNHLRIAENNEKHGPCRMTGKAVFGHNLFSDLDPVEFQSKFLTGYHGPRHDEESEDGRNANMKSMTIARPESSRRSYFRETDATPEASMKLHPDILRKLEEHTMMFGAGTFKEGRDSRLHGSKFQANYASSSCSFWDVACRVDNLATYKISFLNNCAWWDVSCSLRYIFGYQYVGGTREPTYDENTYPSALDWRAMGVVTNVHSQGSCGACWAITAVETIESANAIATGKLIDLAEEEVIACDGTCEMCNGGWPQNAYEYVMKYGGLPATTSQYDADFLYKITAVLAGKSNEVSEYDMGSYFAATCPAGKRVGEGGGGGGNSHKSGDGGSYQYDASYTQSTRYGKIKGYGYATDRCVCYTDGSGCDCDKQNEKTAVLNVASYGPAAVCLEASSWQSYEGGIMTSDIGCSKAFTDMNHCVEVVGYASTYGNSQGGNGGGSQDGKGGQSHKSGGSRDSQLEGYWIVKNQWSSYWGMSGYAYVAMGENTCGILNDMTQVYMS